MKLNIKVTLNFKKTNMKKLVIASVSLFFGITSYAQQDEQMSLYMQNPLYFNPAYAGSRQSLSLVSLARFQWTGFNGAPKSQWFSAHAPIIGDVIGAGVHMVNDQIGSRNRTAVFGDISAGIKLNKKNHKLALGLSGGADFLTFNFSDLTVTDVNDPYYGQQFSSIKPNIGAGLFYYGERHYLGISTPRLLEAKLANSATITTNLNQRHFFLAGGVVIPINSVIEFKPSTTIRYTPKAPITIDVNTSFLLYDKIWLGAMYRFNESVGFNAIFKLKNKLQVGYSYDFVINGLRGYQSGSHEVILTFDVNFRRFTYNSPRYF